ncbi:MAG: ABC transporter permease [Nocardioides sp.]
MRGLLATALRGLRSRGLLTAGALVLTIIAVASAVLGPIYQTGATRSFLVEKLRSEPPILTALTFDYTPDASLSVDAAVVDADAQATEAAGTGFAAPHSFVFSQPGLAPNVGPNGGEPRLVSVPGACQHVQLTGRCPTNLNEIAILAADSQQLGVKIGGSFHPWADSRTVKVVATYRPRAADAGFWLLDTRLQSSPAVPATPINPGHPYRPGPWLTPQSTFEKTLVPWTVVADLTLETPPDLETTQLAAVARHTAALINDQAAALPLPDSALLEPGNALPRIAADVLARQNVARDTVTPAVVSLVLVALVLLSRLLAAAMELRRGELALASLRGWSRRRLWVLGLVEPLLIVGVSTPVGLVLGYLAARVLARSWLVPGLPVPLALGSLAGAALVVVATGVVAVLVVRDALSETLSAQIGGVRRPSKAGRLGLVLQLLMVAAAVVVTFAAATRGHTGAPDATDLLLPILLAVAAGIASGAAALVVADLWVRFTRQRRGLASYVGARTVRRRREGTLVIFPLTAAMAIAVFAAGVSGAAAAWRGSTAATEVGAAASYSTTLSMGQAVRLTHDLDPQGRWLMAIAEDSLPQVDQARLIADTPRLARVADWPTSWTPGLGPGALAQRLELTGPSIELRGSRLGMTVDNRVRGDFAQLGVEVDYLDDQGNTTSAPVGPFRPGRSTQVNRLPHCRQGCTLLRLVFGGPDALVESMNGSAAISSLTLDGHRVADALDRGWRAIDSPIGTPSAVRGAPTVAGGTLSLDFRADTSNSYGAVTTDDAPARVPVLWGRGARQTPRLANG